MNQLGVPRAVALAVTVAGLAAMMWSLAVVLPDGGNAAIVGGGAGRLLLLVYLALVGVLVVASSLSPRLRERNAAAYRVQAAVRRHADPGPELRARADRLARYAASHGWLAWVALFGPAALILGGRWDHPVPAAAGTILLVAAAAGWVWWW